MQKFFGSADFSFEWTADGWYKWDPVKGRQEALAARNAEAKRLKSEGFRVVKFSMPDQLIRRGGIGTSHPDIELWSTCYCLDARKEIL